MSNKRSLNYGLPSFEDAVVFAGVVALGAGIGLASAWWGWSDQSNLTAGDAGVVEHFASGDEGEARLRRQQKAASQGDTKQLDRRFHVAADAVRAHGGFSIDQQTKLYGLFKQATMGACHSPAPSILNTRQTVKWRAWRALGSTTSDDAKRQYCLLVAELLPDHGKEIEAGRQGGQPAETGDPGLRPMPMMGALGPAEEGGDLEFKLPDAQDASRTGARISDKAKHSTTDGGVEEAAAAVGSVGLAPDGVARSPDGEGQTGAVTGDSSASDLRAAAEALARAMEEPTNAEEVRQVLRAAPALVRTSNHYGETPLHIAAELEGAEGLAVVKELLQAGADPNARESGDGLTPIMYAVAAGRYAAAEAMLRGGGDWGAKDNLGHVAADLPDAAAAGDAEQVAALSRLAEVAATLSGKSGEAAEATPQ